MTSVPGLTALPADGKESVGTGSGIERVRSRPRFYWKAVDSQHQYLKTWSGHDRLFLSKGSAMNYVDKQEEGSVMYRPVITNIPIKGM